MKNENLKPVIIDGEKNGNSYYSNNSYAQNLLLKALADGITDPQELKKIAGLQKVSEVYRTLDKMQIRKEYHAALEKAGLDLDFIVGGIKELCTKPDVSDKIKLGALQTVMKSVGLDKYEKDEESGKNWEEIILEAIADKDKGIKGPVIDTTEYEVITPALPEDVRQKQADEKAAAEELYD